MGCDGRPGGEGEEVQHSQQTGGNTNMHLVWTLLTDSVSALSVVTTMTGRTMRAHTTRAYRFMQCGACVNTSIWRKIGDVKGDCVSAQTVHTDSQIGLYSQCGVVCVSDQGTLISPQCN